MTPLPHPGPGPAPLTCGITACDLEAGETQKGLLAPPQAPSTAAKARGGPVPPQHRSGPYRSGIHGILLFPLVPAIFDLLHHLGLGLSHQLPQSLVAGDAADEGMLKGTRRLG